MWFRLLIKVPSGTLGIMGSPAPVSLGPLFPAPSVVCLPLQSSREAALRAEGSKVGALLKILLLLDCQVLT